MKDDARIGRLIDFHPIGVGVVVAVTIVANDRPYLGDCERS